MGKKRERYKQNMASFSEENFSKKLCDLNNSQQSIQTLSLWLIHHRKHSQSIVDTWTKELRKDEVRPSKRLTFLYLANDVIQNSKKKGPEFNKSFRSVLPDAIKHATREADGKMKGQVDRLVNIWKERGVFNADFTNQLKKTLGTWKESEGASVSKREKLKRTKGSRSQK